MYLALNASRDPDIVGGGSAKRGTLHSSPPPPSPNQFCQALLKAENTAMSRSWVVTQHQPVSTVPRR